MRSQLLNLNFLAALAGAIALKNEQQPDIKIQMRLPWISHIRSH
jgi:hypothetical protein